MWPACNKCYDTSIIHPYTQTFQRGKKAMPIFAHLFTPTDVISWVSTFLCCNNEKYLGGEKKRSAKYRKILVGFNHRNGRIGFFDDKRERPDNFLSLFARKFASNQICNSNYWSVFFLPDFSFPRSGFCLNPQVLLDAILFLTLNIEQQ